MKCILRLQRIAPVVCVRLLDMLGSAHLERMIMKALLTLSSHPWFVSLQTIYVKLF
jgi:hypothetical protein